MRGSVRAAIHIRFKNLYEFAVILRQVRPDAVCAFLDLFPVALDIFRRAGAARKKIERAIAEEAVELRAVLVAWVELTVAIGEKPT